MSVDAVVYYRVSNATVSVANVENAHHSTRLLAQTTLRNILGTKNLHEILSDRESISSSMQASSVVRRPFIFSGKRALLLLLLPDLGPRARERRRSGFRCHFSFQSALDEATEPWGIKVERVEM